MTRSFCAIDGDLVGFKAAAACETRTIEVSKDDISVGNFPNRTKFKAWLKDQVGSPDYSEFTIKDVQTVEDIANCLHTVKVMIQSIHAATGCDDVRVVVQGEGNFRDKLLLPSKYKGNRKDTLKPLYLKEAREYLIIRFDAELAHGKESDDVLAAYAYQGYMNKTKIVQCSTDKDANSNVGYLYNWDKMEEPELIQGLGHLIRNDKGEVKGKGRKWFYHQILFGDRSDNYIPYALTKSKFGEKAAFDVINELATDKECWQAIYNTYKTWYPETFEYTAWDGTAVQGDALQQMQMYIDCAHMQRFENDRLIAADILDRMGIEQ
jgi:hypothetical protein